MLKKSLLNKLFIFLFTFIPMISTFTGCDFGTESSADLSNIVLAGGGDRMVDFTFDLAKTDYTVNYNYSDNKIGIKPISENSDAIIKIKNKYSEKEIKSGALYHDTLPVGTNSFTITVTSADSTASKVYNLTVIRAADLSDNNKLSSLAISTGTLSPEFLQSTTVYNVEVANSVTSVTVTATLSASSATLKINGNSTSSGVASSPVALNEGTNTIPVQITAEDGTTLTYKIYVKRLTGSEENTNLASLLPSVGSLSPVFDGDTTAYTVNVTKDDLTIRFTPTVAGTNATVKVNNESVNSGEASDEISLHTGDNTILIEVTAYNSSTKNYILTVNRSEVSVSDNANLASISLKKTDGTVLPITPTFEAGTLTYTATISYDSTSVKVIATIEAGGATITINGVQATPGIVTSVDLPGGSGAVKTIPIVVTSQDGNTTKTYNVTVTKGIEPNHDNKLSSLSISNGSLVPTFDTDTTSYSVSVPYATNTITITPTINDSHSSVTVDGASVTSGTSSQSINLSVGNNPIDVVVTAEDTTTKTYTVTFNRIAANTDSSLSNLTISSGTLSPFFDSSKFSYTAEVQNSVDTITITPTAPGLNASITVNNNSVNSGDGNEVSLNTGSNSVSIVVTAEDGSHTTYLLDINRLGMLNSSNADLADLTISEGILDPVFSKDTTGYSITVLWTVTSIDITPTVEGINATLKVDGTTILSGNSKNIILTEGDNSISVQVTAENGFTSKTYNITVHRKEIWVKTAGDTDTDIGHSITTDSSGNVYTAGQFGGTVDFNPTSSTDSKTSLGSFDIFVTKINSDGTYGWTQTIGGTGIDIAEDVTTDSSGNIYITGLFQGENIDFDFSAGSDLHSSHKDSGDTNYTLDMFVTKINSDGTYGWTKTFGGIGMEFGKGITVDSSENIFITGYFQETVDFGGGDVTSAGKLDIFVLKLDSTGTYQWVSTFGGAENDEPSDIALDSTGNIFLTGYFKETVQFNGTDDVTSEGGKDIFLLKLDSTGAYSDCKTYGSSDDDEGNAIAIDTADNIYVTGSFRNTINFGQGDISSVGGTDSFIIAFNSSLVSQWTRGIGGSDSDVGYDIIATGSGTDDVYITGSFQKSVDFDNDASADFTANGKSDLFVIKLGADDGVTTWTKVAGGTEDDIPFAITAQGSYLYITGLYQETVDFDPGTGTYDVNNHTSNGDEDIFILRLLNN